MKKILIFSICSSLSIAVFAQKMNAAKVPVAVKQSFVLHFPGSIARWEKEAGHYEANFKKDTNDMSALFDPNGTMTESEVTIQKTDLPKSALAYIENNFKGSAIRESAKITKADGTVNFEAEVNHKDLLFDKDGHYLSIVKD